MILGLVLSFTAVALMNPSQNLIFLKSFRFIKRLLLSRNLEMCLFCLLFLSLVLIAFDAC